ncbi:DNA polymerase [Lysinibacillus sp. CD3-6]|uniref:DNA polymerase n=1 Tax=Lysinibacillus sp. CD3-6 TaxID=2892541 RepID=UPI00111D810A|nr:DNA polymerase [Lysinibacillus sp. CD3-6]UED81925.1 DNA polymerase [Lysinibacillus sp. CD3-6]
MNTLNIDIETYSSYDLKKVGVYKYCEAPDFDILIFAYSVDGHPTVTIELARGESIPPEIIEALVSPKVLKKAFNAQFERVALTQYLIRNSYYFVEEYESAFSKQGFLSPKQWRCTMVDAMKAGLPATLKGAALALELDEQKDSAGTHLINFFSKPRKPTKNDKRTRNMPEDDLEKWNAFVEYCRQDVETEKAVGYAVDPYLNLGSKSDKFEMALYHLDQEINDRGVLLDMSVVDGALAIDETYKAKLMGWGKKITWLENPNSPKQLMEWFKEQGLELPNLTKDTVKTYIQKTDGDIRTMLEIRQELSKTSTAKFVTMKAAVCADGRVRGLLQFYGASRTGRWAGRLVQVQNLPQNKISDIEIAREIVANADIETLEMLYDQVPFVLSQLIRTAFVPVVKKTFAVSDFSAIEARVIAWLAGERWRLEVFNTHGKIYEASAAQMFKVPIETIDKGSPLRQKGKVAELALGYQGGENALISMGALEMGIEQTELKPLVDAWRKANPKIKKLWWDIEAAAMRAIENPGEVISFNKGMKFFMLHGSLMMHLPSGRRLCYYKARLQDHKTFEGKQEIVFWGVDGTTKAWCETSTYGGKLTENAVQAIARDCLAMSMLRLDKEGYPIVMHIHDEAVMESDVDTIAIIEEIMGRPISWAEGLPLEADGFETPFYKKD